MFDGLRNRKKIQDLQERCDRLERRVSALEIDWTDTLDRLKRMQGRIIKERSRSEAANPLPPMEEIEGNGSDTTLSPRAQQINAQILARRNRMKAQ